MFTIFPTRVGVFPTTGTACADAIHSPHISGGVSDELEAQQLKL